MQTFLYWEKIEANLAHFEEKIWTLESAVDLIILPEMFTTGFTMNPKGLSEIHNGKTFRWMSQRAEQTGAVVMGSYIVAEAGSFYNRLYVVFPDGRYQSYDKRHLFGLAGEDQNYRGGSERLVFELNGWRIMPQICYDLRFPVWSRSQSDEGHLYEYDLITFSANWPRPRINAWDTLLQARAIENQCFSIGVNRIGSDEAGMEYTGHSAAYDFLGEKLVDAEGADTVVMTELDGDSLMDFRTRYPFQADADPFDLAQS